MEVIIAEKKDLGFDIAKGLNPNFEDKGNHLVINDKTIVT